MLGGNWRWLYLTCRLTSRVNYFHISDDLTAAPVVDLSHMTARLHVDFRRLRPVYDVFKLRHSVREEHQIAVALDHVLVVCSIDGE